MTGRHRPKPRRVAWSLAACAVVMVLAATAAVFLPSGGKATTSLQRRVPAWFLIHPRPSGAANTTPLSPSPSPSPNDPLPPGTAQPVAFPAPVRTFPAPAARTFPAPSPRSVPPPRTVTVSPSDPAGDLPPAQTLTPPIQGVVAPDVATWNALTGHRAQLTLRYVSMARPLADSWLHSVLRTGDGAEPVIEITPTAPGQPPLTLAQIAAGAKDGWLRSLAGQIAALHHPVVISFAPEDNGTWYAWSQESPAAFTAAWRHVHAVIGTAGVTWLWQVSAANPATDRSAADPLPAYYPGGDVVDWVGLDGYFWRTRDTFESRFAHTLGQVATLGKPVLIAETAVAPDDVDTGKPLNMAADIRLLFDGVAAHRLLGLVYFDLAPGGPQQGGPFHPDFRLEQYPAALGAYRNAITTWP